MLSLLFNNPLNFLFLAVAFIIALTVHEFAHAWVADRLGDPTPRAYGRLSLNPLAHLDWLGTIMILIGPIGWGKPVPIDDFNFRNPKRDITLVSIAGIAVNLIVAVIGSIILRLIAGSALANIVAGISAAILQYLIIINVNLAVFNLIPVSPLDGFKVVAGLLPSDKTAEWLGLQSYGLIFLLFLILPIFGGTAPINYLINPPINFLLQLLIP